MDLHYIQLEILVELGKTESLKFGEFNTPSHLHIEKDLFNYHLQTLTRLNLVKKVDGEYSLAAEGKKYVSRLDFVSKREEKLPKLSIMIILVNKEDSGKILLAKRLKHPFRGEFALMTGKIRAGESFEQSMSRECFEETGLVPTRSDLLGIYRWTNFEANTQQLLHDGVFVLFKVFDYTGELVEKNEENENIWVNITDLPLESNGSITPTQKLVTTSYADSAQSILFYQEELMLDSF